MENTIIVDDDYGLPDSDHLETSLQGLSDTLDMIEGNESLSLTSAQQYLYTCIGLNGGISRRDAVIGAEGFFDSVGDGLGKLWDFIKRMFKAITDFFFGGGKAEKKEKAAEETVKKAEEALQTIGKPSADGETFDQLASRLLSELKAIEGEGKKEADEAIEKIEKADDKDAKAKAVAEIQANVLPRINSRAKAQVKSLTERGEAAADAFAKKISEDHTATFAGTPFARLYSGYHDKISASSARDRTFMTKAAGMIHNLADAQRALRTLSEVLGGYTDDRKTVAQYKSSIESEINQIDSRMKSTTRGKVPKELKKDLKVCGEFLKLMNDTSGNLENAYDRIEAMAKAICRLFGIKL